jgi:23S rRNA U2552 (ribose-2'-O)-methylase RlmE/FtsJ
LAAGKSWLEMCAEGHKVYYGESVARQGREVIGQYTQGVMDQSRRFVKTIAKPGMCILDLGSSGEPWFSFLAADAGAKLVAYDIEPPAQPNMLKEKGIEYIQGNVSKLDNLGRFDLIFCRNLYPAQLLQD